MKELNLSVYTGEKGDNKVTMTATFEDHDAAVAFHEGVSRLCRDASNPRKDSRPGYQVMKMLGR